MLKKIRELLGGRRRGESPAEHPAVETPGPSSPHAAEASPPQIHRGPQVVHRPIPESDLDPDAVKIVRRLTRFDHRAYFVGGCVRDLLLERRPKDFDIGTSATPRQIKRLFRNCRIIGRRFRLAHVYFQNGKIIEVATFRAQDAADPDEAAPDDLMIRDDNVFGTPEEDALRRDFTINALFYDLVDQTVLDHADGLNDLRRRLVRSIGDPQTRFREDPIRCLRAIKFAARLGFDIEPKTLAALRHTRSEILKAAAPRVLEELIRFCRGAAARASFELARETEVLDVVLPDLARAYRADPGAWRSLLDLLGHMDESRSASSREIRIGEMFAALLLPLVAPRLGWKEDGTVEDRRGLDLRRLVDEPLQPSALALRIPRREQEYCRQVLSTIARMVPASRARRGARRALVRREATVDALWMLEVLAKRRGGELAASAALWHEGADAEPAASPRVGEPEPEGTGRRRRRRGGRRRRGAGAREAGAPVTASAPRESAEPRRPKPAQRDLPPVWDDRYFFAALPDAPPLEADGDPEPPALEESAAAAPDSTDGTRPRRRRRSRRRGKRSSERRPEGGDGGSEPSRETETADTAKG
jgi:poly(A) polymerase